MSKATKKEYNLLLHNLTQQVLAFNDIYEAEVSITISPAEVSLYESGTIIETEEFSTE